MKILPKPSKPLTKYSEDVGWYWYILILCQVILNSMYDFCGCYGIYISYQPGKLINFLCIYLELTVS